MLAQLAAKLRIGSRVAWRRMLVKAASADCDLNSPFSICAQATMQTRKIGRRRQIRNRGSDFWVRSTIPQRRGHVIRRARLVRQSQRSAAGWPTSSAFSAPSGRLRRRWSWRRQPRRTRFTRMQRAMSDRTDHLEAGRVAQCARRELPGGPSSFRPVCIAETVLTPALPWSRDGAVSTSGSSSVCAVRYDLQCRELDATAAGVTPMARLPGLHLSTARGKREVDHARGDHQHQRSAQKQKPV